MTIETGLHHLLAWSSPSYPVGAYTYSHGLETAVEDGDIADPESMVAYIEAVLRHGGGWIDAVLFARCYDVAADPISFDEVAELAVAFRATAETALESRQQGKSFLSVTKAAWPHVALDAFAERWSGRAMAQTAVMALAAHAHGLDLNAALRAYLHGLAANLVSAGVRLVPLGQTDGQIATAQLSEVIDEVAHRAIATPVDELGSAGPMLEIASIRHETLYTRLFRS